MNKTIIIKISFIYTYIKKIKSKDICINRLKLYTRNLEALESLENLVKEGDKKYLTHFNYKYKNSNISF